MEMVEEMTACLEAPVMPPVDGEEAAAEEALAPEESPRKKKEKTPYHLKTSVGTAKYSRPSTSASLKNLTLTQTFPGAGSAVTLSPLASPTSPTSSIGFKTEKWREAGVQRWPTDASQELKRQPTQFMKSEEVVPLQRTVENPQNNIHSELWCRSLRTEGLPIQRVGLHNQNVATAAVSMMFGKDGTGFTGRTRTSTMRPLASKTMHDWVERPVAVGKLALDHMGGSLYSMDMTPRPCVPNSMVHSPPASPRSPRAATAR